MTSRIGAVSWLLAAVCACSSNSVVHVQDDNPTDPSNLAGYCEGLCRREAACDASLKQRDCVKECRTDRNEAQYDNFRSEYVKRLSSCFDAASCEKLDADTCEAEAESGLSPSDTTARFCGKFTVDPKCGLLISEAKCLEDYKKYDDAPLSAARRKCKDLPCETQLACVLAVLSAPP